MHTQMIGETIAERSSLTAGDVHNVIRNLMAVMREQLLNSRATCGNIINCSYKLFVQTKPDGVLVLGDTNSCLSVIGAKRLHIPIFHMEAGNRCKDECLPEETNRRIVDIISDVNMAYSEHARRYLADCGLPKERTYVPFRPLRPLTCINIS